MLAGFEPSLLKLAREAALADERLHLLQLVLRAVDEDSPVTHEFAPLRSVLAGVIRSSALLDTRLASGDQPFPSLIKDVCAGARDAVVTARRLRGHRVALKTAERALAAVIALPGGNTFTAGCATPAADLRPLGGLLERMVRDDLVAYWDDTRARRPDVRYLAREAAFLLVSRRRHEDGIRRSIEKLLRSPDRSGQRLLEALFPPARPHRVACTLDGADRLEHLDDLRPDAQQFALGEPVSGWGHANDRLEAYAHNAVETRPGGPHPRPGCVVSLRIDAPDPEAAAAIGYRELSELLDHYVSGHRLVDVSIRGDVLVSELGRRTAQWRSMRGLGVAEAHPLSVAWPPSLKEAMRMAHIARTTHSPMAAAALSWSAIEAADLDAAPLAGALALQTMRHRLVQTHGEILAGIAASRAARRIEDAIADDTATRLRAVLTDFAGPDAARGSVESRLASADDRAMRARDEVARHETRVEDCLARIRSHVTWSARGHLYDLNAWLDLLRPERPADNAAVRQARAGLTDLLDELPPAATGIIVLWRDRLARPSTAARWLDEARDGLFAELRWLYATRNLTIHTGQTALPGDVQLAVAASGLADVTLEFLGTWYGVAAARRLAAFADRPDQIVAALDARRTAIADHLRARHILTRLHAEHLTSCTSTGWDR